MNCFYYDDDLNIYKTHFEAIRSPKPCWIYYGDDFFKTINWKREPTLSLPELYKLRAQEIRDSYEYVVLCLSGGIDSRTMFESFYRNNIHIDQIICVGAYSQDLYQGSIENNNDEIYNNVKQLLIDCVLPKTKISYLDYSEHFRNINNFSILKNYGNDWPFHTQCWKSIHHFYWRDIETHINISNKKTALVFGCGKTRLEIDQSNNNPFVWYIEDDLMAYYFEEHDSFKRENFYFGVSQIGAEIVKKQAFIMYDYFNRISDKVSFFRNYIKFYNHIIYDYSLIKPTRKSSNKFLSIRDKYILRHTNSDLYKIYFDGLKHFQRATNMKYPIYTTKPYYLK